MPASSRLEKSHFHPKTYVSTALRAGGHSLPPRLQPASPHGLLARTALVLTRLRKLPARGLRVPAALYATAAKHHCHVWSVWCATHADRPCPYRGIPGWLLQHNCLTPFHSRSRGFWTSNKTKRIALTDISSEVDVRQLGRKQNKTTQNQSANACNGLAQNRIWPSGLQLF